VTHRSILFVRVRVVTVDEKVPAFRGRQITNWKRSCDLNATIHAHAVRWIYRATKHRVRLTARCESDMLTRSSVGKYVMLLSTLRTREFSGGALRFSGLHCYSFIAVPGIEPVCPCVGYSSRGPDGIFVREEWQHDGNNPKKGKPLPCKGNVTCCHSVAKKASRIVQNCLLLSRMTGAKLAHAKLTKRLILLAGLTV